MCRPNRRALAALILQVLAPLAHATTYTVNSNTDPISGNALNCAMGNANTCTLRDSIASAANGDVITFSADMNISLVSGQALSLSKDLTVDGNDHTVKVDGANKTTVFAINSGVNVVINHLTIQNAYVINANGGGIYNQGSTTLSNSTVSDNKATYGGGIFNKNTLTVINTTVTGNIANGGGGGINNAPYGNATVISSTVAENMGPWGGGINNFGTMHIANSTISGNHAAAGGGVRNWNATLTAVNSTISGNTASLSYSGAGIDSRYGVTTFTNTIIADGCFGTLADQGGNLDSGTSCGLNIASSKSNAILDLGALENNGGPTPTITPGADSAALGAGLDSVCAASPINNLDQRGITRPQGSHCDAGAVERRPIEDHIFNNGFDI